MIILILSFETQNVSGDWKLEEEFRVERAQEMFDCGENSWLWREPRCGGLTWGRDWHSVKGNGGGWWARRGEFHPHPPGERGRENSKTCKEKSK